jgi:hypothetical protein
MTNIGQRKLQALQHNDHTLYIAVVAMIVIRCNNDNANHLTHHTRDQLKQMLDAGLTARCNNYRVSQLTHRTRNNFT